MTLCFIRGLVTTSVPRWRGMTVARQTDMRVVTLSLLLMCAIGCDQSKPQPPASKAATSTPAPAPAQTSQPVTPVEAPASTAQIEATKPCFRCGGSGTIHCAAPGCKDGQIECPGPCLKLSKGVWVHMQVAGHSADDVWQKFPKSSGGWEAWNQNHVGEVIEVKNGVPVNVGKCPVCTGSTRVQCPTCFGTGKAVCNLCGGKKMIPDSWTEFDNPTQKVKPTTIQLTDGRSLVGRIQMRLGSKIYVRTEDGKQVEVNTGEIVAEKPVR